jgi:DNA ligase-1
MSATLLEFALTNDALSATSSKLKKQSLLAAYLRQLREEDLGRAVRYAGGRVFAATDERVLNVGGRTLFDLLPALMNLDAAKFHHLAMKNGEIGEALSIAWPLRDMDSALTLGDLAMAFEDIAATGNGQRKREILERLFFQCAHPREAAYIAKIISGDLRTGVQEGVLQAGVAEAFNCTLAEIQRGMLLLGNLDEVAVLAKNGRLGEAKFRLFHPIQFMLATPLETAADAEAKMAGRSFIAEDKLDGIRAQIHKAGDRVAIFTRTMDRTDESFPEVIEAMRGMDGDFLLDGEIVPWRDGAVLPFAHIQKRLGRKMVSAKVRRENPVAFVAFDVLYRNGELLMDQPLAKRRGILQQMPQVVRLPGIEVQSAAQVEQAFADARQRRNEGIVLKDLQSPYSPGRRGQMWLKIKTHLPTFDCVVTAAEYGHGKRKAVLSDYTFAVWDADPAAGGKLLNIGKAYSGVTDQEIAQLTELFLGISLGQRGRVHAVPSRVVLEIACDQIQRSERHASGYAMRFPRIMRIRWDKKPKDADLLSRVREVYESQANFGRANVVAEVEEPGLFDGM